MSEGDVKLPESLNEVHVCSSFKESVDSDAFVEFMNTLIDSYGYYEDAFAEISGIMRSENGIYIIKAKIRSDIDSVFKDFYLVRNKHKIYDYHIVAAAVNIF